MLIRFALGWLLLAYLGYPLLAAAWAFLFRRPVRRDERRLPTTTLVIPAFNEEKWIGRKLVNALDLDYPRDRLEIAVAIDGADDGTRRVAEGYRRPGLAVYGFHTRRGKISVMNDVAARTTGELLVFSDANAFLRPDALRKLARNFADPSVGAACGRLVLEGRHYASVTRPETVYWNYDNLVKALETESGSTVGVVGSLFAIRRSLFTGFPEDTILDDLEMALAAIGRGFRVVYDPEAIAHERMVSSTSKELARKVRLVSGGFRAARRHVATLRRRPEAALKLAGHKVLRWLAWIPLLLLLLHGARAWRRGDRRPLLLQAAFYLSPLPEIAVNLLREAVTGRRDIKVRHAWFPFYFALVNAAAAVGLLRHLLDAQPVTWAVTRDE